jgi:glycosyltransferase involved in cell wall biosynthesis
LRERFNRIGLLVPNCFEERQPVDGHPDGPVLWVGTIKPRKRPELFLELAASWPERRFIMIGGAVEGLCADHGYAQAIEARARQIRNLEFVGFVPYAKVGNFFDGAAVLVNTSDAEGFPNTFLQAWIRGIPSLSFVAPMTNDESTGTIACRSLTEMNELLAELLRARELWHDKSSRVREYFGRFHSLDAVLPAYEAVFKDIR